MLASSLVTTDSSNAVPDTATLFDVAGPDLYRRNAFRVIELPVTASAREIDKRRQLVEMAVRGQVAIPAGRQPLLRLPAGADAGEVREATQRLRDPGRRLLDEFFWFWERLDGVEDPALAALAAGDVTAAQARWKETIARGGTAGALALHNRAVWRHAHALDQLSASKRPGEIATLMDEALADWQRVRTETQVWTWLSERVRTLDDPRLPPSVVEHYRASLGVAIVLVSAQVAVRLAEAGRTDAAKAFVGPRTGVSGFSSAEIAQALRIATRPLRERLLAMCKAAEPAAEADPASADAVTERLLEQATPLLAVLDAVLLSKDDPGRAGAHDEVALRALTCLIIYGNTTENWARADTLATTIAPLALSESARERVARNREIIHGNLELGTCWYCKQRPSHSASEYDIAMYGDVTRTPTYNGVHVQWRHGSVGVPRCAECKGLQSREKRFRVLGTICGWVSGFVTLALMAEMERLLWGSNDSAPGIYMWISFAVAIGTGIAVNALFASVASRRTKAAGSHPADYGKEHPIIKKRLADGWKFGNKPATS